MKKTTMKKLIAIICAIALLPWGSFAYQNVLRAEASTTVTSPDALETWSTDNPGGYTKAGAFRAKITFPDASSLSGNSATALNKYEDFKLGLWNTANYDGILLRACPGFGNSTAGDDTQLTLYYTHGRSVYLIADKVLNASDFGLTKLLGEELDLVVTTEYVNSNGTTATLNLGIYINGHLYKDSYITVSGVNANGLAKTSSYSTGITVKKWQKVTSPDELESWSTDSTSGYTTAGAFRAKVTFPDASSLSGNSAAALSKYEDFKLGLWNTAGYDGILLRACPGFGNSTAGDDTQLTLYYTHGQSVYLIADKVLNASDFGLTKLLGEELDLVVTTEYVNSNGTTATLNLGIYINGHLYQDSYISISGADAKGLVKTSSCSTGITTQVWKDEYETWSTDSTSGYTKKGAFKAKVTFPDASVLSGNSAGTLNNYADLKLGKFSEAGYDGILLRACPGFGNSTKGDNTQLTLYYTHGKSYLKTDQVLNASDFGLDKLLGEELDLVVTNQYIQSNGTTATLKLGIYINGHLYQDSYISISGADAKGLVKSSTTKDVTAKKWKNETAQKPVTPWEELERWSITDVGLAEGEFGDDKSGTATGANQDGTAFVAAVKFPKGIRSSSGHSSELWIGEYANGYYFEVKDDTVKFYHWISGIGPTLLTELSPELAGRSKLVGSEMDIILTTEFENNNGTTTDANVALYIDGKLYGDEYFRLEGVPVNAFPQQVYVRNKWAGGKTIWMSSVLRPEAPPITAPEALEKWTIETVGMTDGEYNVHTGKATGKTLDGKAFYGAVKFPAISEQGRDAQLWIGEYMNGFGFKVENGILKFIHQSTELGEILICILDPEEAGVETFLDEKMDITLTTEFVNKKKTTTDVYVGLYINGSFYGSRYFKLEKLPITSLKQQIEVFNRWAGGKTTWLWVDSQADLDELLAKDFGLQNKVVENDTFVAKAGDASLMATAISMELNFPDKKGSTIYFGGEECGVALQSEGKGSMGIAYVSEDGQVTDIATLNPKKLGLTSLTNRDVGMRLVFKVYERTNTLELGVFVNGLLYEEKYFTVKNIDINALQRIIGIHAKDAKIMISNPQYEELTFNDFSILDVKLDTKTVSPSYQRYNYYDLALLGKTAVSGTIKFVNAAGTYLTIGGEQWMGIRLFSRADGRLEVNYSPTKGAAKYFYLEPSVAGVKSLYKTDIDLRITFDILQLSSERADLQMGIYINGKLYNDEFFKITNVDTTVLTRTCYICTVVGPMKLESVKEPIDLGIYGLDADWKKTLGLK